MVDSTLKPYSPLDDASVMVGASSLSAQPLCGKINLRGDGSDNFRQQCYQILNLELPLTARTIEKTEDLIIFWLGPNEWLLYCDLTQTQKLMTQLSAQLKGLHHALTEVSDYYCVIYLSGSTSGEILARGTPFDLSPSRFTPGDCVQTRFGHASVLIHAINTDPSYNIQVRWSFACYVWEYLVEVARHIEDCID